MVSEERLELMMKLGQNWDIIVVVLLIGVIAGAVFSYSVLWKVDRIRRDIRKMKDFMNID